MTCRYWSVAGSRSVAAARQRPTPPRGRKAARSARSSGAAASNASRSPQLGARPSIPAEARRSSFSIRSIQMSSVRESASSARSGLCETSERTSFDFHIPEDRCARRPRCRRCGRRQSGEFLYDRRWKQSIPCSGYSRSNRTNTPTLTRSDVVSLHDQPDVTPAVCSRRCCGVIAATLPRDFVNCPNFAGEIDTPAPRAHLPVYRNCRP